MAALVDPMIGVQIETIKSSLDRFQELYKGRGDYSRIDPADLYSLKAQVSTNLSMRRLVENVNTCFERYVKLLSNEAIRLVDMDPEANKKRFRDMIKILQKFKLLETTAQEGRVTLLSVNLGALSDTLSDKLGEGKIKAEVEEKESPQVADTFQHGAQAPGGPFIVRSPAPSIPPHLDTAYFDWPEDMRVHYGTEFIPAGKKPIGKENPFEYHNFKSLSGFSKRLVFWKSTVTTRDLKYALMERLKENGLYNIEVDKIVLLLGGKVLADNHFDLADGDKIFEENNIFVIIRK